jgi:hypothetical protein
VAQQTIVPQARRAAEGYSGPLAPRRPLAEAANRDPGQNLDEPRPQFRREEVEASAAARKQGAGFNLFGWMRGGVDEPRAAIEPEPSRTDTAPGADASSDEDLEIPAFLRRQIQPPR